MTRAETIRAIGEIAALMETFADDKAELAQLAARMQVRLDHLKAHASAGRPDLAATLRDPVATMREFPVPRGVIS